MDFHNSLIYTHIRDRGPQITIDDVIAFESEIGARLPEDYIDFLLYCNGGRFYENTIEYPTPHRPYGDIIGGFEFFGLDRFYRRHIVDLRPQLAVTKSCIPEGTIPIASCAFSTDLLLLSPNEGGRLFYWDNEIYHENELSYQSNFKENKLFIADSFANFCCGCFFEPIEERERYTREKEEPFKSIELHSLPTLVQYLDDGVPLFTTNDQGQTLLYCACAKRDYCGALELLQRGANPDDGDRLTGKTPLAISVYCTDMMKLLLSYDASKYLDPEETLLLVDTLEFMPVCQTRDVLLGQERTVPLRIRSWSE